MLHDHAEPKQTGPSAEQPGIRCNSSSRIKQKSVGTPVECGRHAYSRGPGARIRIVARVSTAADDELKARMADRLHAAKSSRTLKVSLQKPIEPRWIGLRGSPCCPPYCHHFLES